jgi:hypothetical protein
MGLPKKEMYGVMLCMKKLGENPDHGVATARFFGKILGPNSDSYAHDMCPKRSFTHQLATTTKASSERFSMPGLEVERRCSHASSLITWTLRIPCALVHGQIPATNRVC